MSDDRSGESDSVDGSAAEPGSDSQDTPTDKEVYARSLNDQGVWFVTAGRPHLAVRCFRRACVACPLLSAAWTNLAATLVLLGRNKDALLAIRCATQAGAISRSAAACYRTTIRQNVSSDQLVVRRHPVQQTKKSDQHLRRPRKTCKAAPRKQVSIYTLLRSAAYDMICERKIPAA